MIFCRLSSIPSTKNIPEKYSVKCLSTRRLTLSDSTVRRRLSALRQWVANSGDGAQSRPELGGPSATLCPPRWDTFWRLLGWTGSLREARWDQAAAMTWGVGDGVGEGVVVALTMDSLPSLDAAAAAGAGLSIDLVADVSFWVTSLAMWLLLDHKNSRVRSWSSELSTRTCATEIQIYR